MFRKEIWIALPLSIALGCGGAQKRPPSVGDGGDELIGPAPKKIDRNVSREATADFAAAVKFYQQQAKAGWTQSRCKSAADKFDDVASSHNKMVEARFNAGLSHQHCKQWDDATAQYKKALAIKSDHAHSLANLGEIAFQKGDEATARSYWERAVKADGRIAAARANLAWLTIRDMRKTQPKGATFRKMNKAAADQLSRVLAVENENVEAHVLYALLYMEGSERNRSRLALANIFLDKAEKISANYAPLHNARGLLLLHRNSVAPALKSFRRAVELDPSFVEARMNVGNIVLDFRKYAEGEAQFRAVLEIQPRNYDALIGLGISQRGTKKLDDAEASYKEALKVDSSRADAYFNLGVLYQDFRANATEDLNQSKNAYNQAIGYFRSVGDKSGDRRLKKEAAENIKVCEKNIKLIDQAIEFQKGGA